MKKSLIAVLVLLILAALATSAFAFSYDISTKRITGSYDADGNVEIWMDGRLAGGNILNVSAEEGLHTIEVYVNGKLVKTETVAVPVTVMLSKSSVSFTGDKGAILIINTNGAAVKSYKSSSTKVASVTKNGTVTLKKAGSAKITVTLKNGKKRTLKLTVKDPTLPKKISISTGKKVTLIVGEKLQLNVAITPTTAAGNKLTWKSSKKTVATVNSKGTVTAKKAGTAKVTVKTSNGKTATITIKVTKK